VLDRRHRLTAGGLASQRRKPPGRKMLGHVLVQPVAVGVGIGWWAPVKLETITSRPDKLVGFVTGSLCLGRGNRRRRRLDRNGVAHSR